VKGESLTKNGEQGLKTTARSLPSAAFRQFFAPVRYSFFTAADEKVPLSVVQVNNKPQYLVFLSHSGHLFSKHRHLPVESLKQPCAARVFNG
jgi:hypothetical protein